MLTIEEWVLCGNPLPWSRFSPNLQPEPNQECWTVANSSSEHLTATGTRVLIFAPAVVLGSATGIVISVATASSGYCRIVAGIFARSGYACDCVYCMLFCQDGLYIALAAVPNRRVGSGSGSDPEPNRCNRSYQTKTQTVAIGSVLPPKTRH